MKSISARLYWSILLVCSIAIVLMATLVYAFTEDMEDTIVEVNFSADRDYIIQNFTQAGTYIWDSQGQKIAFIPNGEALPVNMPADLRGLSEGMVHEFEEGDQIFIGKRQQLDTGVLYYAKNITAFEDREHLFQKVLIGVIVFMILLSAILSYISSQRIVKPWRQLSNDISAVPVGKDMPLIQMPYEEAELYTIASNFNQFLAELNAYVTRENSLLGLASHELRTPIAVMAGALDIIESRQQLNERDQITLGRVRQACNEMQMNVETILKLARKEEGTTQNEIFYLNDVLVQVKEDLSLSFGSERVTLTLRQQKVKLLSDVFLSKMLVRNLLQNALQHTKGAVRIQLYDAYFDVEDEGVGLTEAQQAILQGQAKEMGGSHGFGLYIVTMVSERLGWSMEIERLEQAEALLSAGVSAAGISVDGITADGITTAQNVASYNRIRVHFTNSRYYL